MEQKDPPEGDRRTRGRGWGSRVRGGLFRISGLGRGCNLPGSQAAGTALQGLRGESDLRWPQPEEAWSRVSAPEIME